MRCACIDIGSNTTRLLVAEPADEALVEIVGDRAFTRIGAACGPDGTIPPAKIAEVAEVVAGQAALADAHGAGAVVAVATAAIRRAPNRTELLTAIRERSGVAVEVLDGEDEARLAFLGATGTLPGRPATGDPHRPLAVVDVGGGSTEVVVGTAAGGVTWSVSLPIGSTSLAAGGVTDHDVLHARAAAAFAELEVPPVGHAVAVGGSASSTRRIVGEELGEAALREAFAVVTTTPVSELCWRHEIAAERAAMLPAGLAILLAATRALGGLPLAPGRGGLREGVVLQELARRRVL